MVSIGPSSQCHNMTHMWDIPDLRGCQVVSPPSNSLMGIIENHPDFSKFRYMVKLAKFENIFSDPQANITLFVPSDQELEGINEDIFNNMDNTTARYIIKSTTLDHRIPSDLLENSPASYFTTQCPYNKLFITNISGRTYINNFVNVIHKDWIADNGIIHVIDQLIWPVII